MSKYLGMKYNMMPQVHQILDQGDARIATVREQADWVVGHFTSHNGNQSYRFPLKKSTNDITYVINKDIDLPPLWGAEALTIMVPMGVKVKHGILGNNKLLYMDDFRMEGADWSTINLGPALMDELGHERHLWAEDFIYAEAESAARDHVTEKTLGLVGEAGHAPPVNVVLSSGLVE